VDEELGAGVELGAGAPVGGGEAGGGGEPVVEHQGEGAAVGEVVAGEELAVGGRLDPDGVEALAEPGDADGHGAAVGVVRAQLDRVRARLVPRADVADEVFGGGHGVGRLGAGGAEGDVVGQRRRAAGRRLAEERRQLGLEGGRGRGGGGL